MARQATSEKIKGATPTTLIVSVAAVITGLAALFALYEILKGKLK